MRTISKGRGFFHGTHKGHEIEIEREADPEMRERGHRFYIRVWNIANGLHGYDGWSRENVHTMADAKREALYGACLKARPETPTERDREGHGTERPLNASAALGQTQND